MKLIIFFFLVVLSLKADYSIEVLRAASSQQNLQAMIKEADTLEKAHFKELRIELDGEELLLTLGNYKEYDDALKDIVSVQKIHKDATIRRYDLTKKELLHIEEDSKKIEKKHFDKDTFWSSGYTVDANCLQKRSIAAPNQRAKTDEEKFWSSGYIIDAKCLKKRTIAKVNDKVEVQKESVFADKNQEAYHTLEKAYKAEISGNKDEAYSLFDTVTDKCSEASLYNKACKGVIMYHPFKSKYFQDPYYTSLYAETVWFQRRYQPETLTQKNFVDTVYQIKAKAGRYFDDNKKTSFYLFAHVDGDTNSKAGDIPIIYSENYAGVGIGLDYKPIKQVRLFIETSLEKNFISSTNQDIQNDYRIGAEYYDQWGPGMNLECSYNAKVNFDWFGDLYLSAADYSRYDNNIIFQGYTRLGARLLNYKMSNLSAYARLGITADTKGDFFNNVADIGPGVELKPYQPFPLSIRLEYRLSKYFKNVKSGDTDRFNSFFLYGILYFEK